MHFKVSKRNFLDALNLVSKAISPTSALPQLSGILIRAEENEITIIASDSNISIRSLITNNSNEILQIFEEGQILIESKYILEMIRKIDSEFVTIERVDGTLIRISGGNAEFKINGLSPDDYPRIEFESMSAPFDLETATFIKIIEQTAFACSDNDTRPVLTGVNLKAKDGVLHASGTDSYRLAYKKVSIDQGVEFNVTIPAKYLSTIIHSISNQEKMTVAIDSQKVTFRYGDSTIETRILDDAFPDTARLIPASFTQVLEVRGKDVVNAVDRSSFIKSDGKNTVRLSINEKEVDMTSSNNFGSSYENIPVISFTGNPFEISCNGKYLQDAIKAIGAEIVTISFNGELKPLIISNKEDDSIVQLVSPMRTYH